jgi:hypothetical protein
MHLGLRHPAPRKSLHASSLWANRGPTSRLSESNGKSERIDFIHSWLAPINIHIHISPTVCFDHDADARSLHRRNKAAGRILGQHPTHTWVRR